MTCIPHSLNLGLVFLDNSFADVDWASEAPQREEFPCKQEDAHQAAHVAYEYGLGCSNGVRQRQKRYWSDHITPLKSVSRDRARKKTSRPQCAVSTSFV